jgi:clan AA aspartic protease
MGLTTIRAKVANPANPRRVARVTFLVDSGAIYSIVPANVLRRLGIKPHRKTRTFTLADGSSITREIGNAIFQIDGESGASPVIFGETGDSSLLGAVSLEAAGLLLDPVKRILRPLPMVLG